MWFTVFYYHYNDAFWHSLIPRIIACHYYHLVLRPCKPQRPPDSTDKKYTIRFRKIMLSNISLLLSHEYSEQLRVCRQYRRELKGKTNYRHDATGDRGKSTRLLSYWHWIIISKGNYIALYENSLTVATCWKTKRFVRKWHEKKFMKI